MFQGPNLLWSTDLAETWHRIWVWWDISKATLAHFSDFKFWSFGGGGVSFFALHHQKSSLSGGILKVQHRLATEIRRKITDLTMFFKIKTGNVRISFPNDLREVHCPYLTRGSAQHPFHLQRYSSTINVFRKNCSRLERFVSCFRTCWFRCCVPFKYF